MQCRGLEKALDQIEAERNAKIGEDAAVIAKAAGVEVGALSQFPHSQDILLRQII